MEIAILSAHFSIEIHSIDVKSLRVDKFGQGSGFKSRVFLIYSGIHYDALSLSPMEANHVDEFDQTQFTTHVGPGVDTLLECALSLARGLQAMKKYTDLANFTLKCDDCKQVLKKIIVRTCAEKRKHNLMLKAPVTVAL